MVITELEQLASGAEALIASDISRGEITPDTIVHFQKLEQGFSTVANELYSELDGKFMPQLVAYGASETAARLCKGISENLVTAKKRGDNPIAAERLKDRKYILYIQLVISGLKGAYAEKNISTDDYYTINDSLRALTRLAIEDGIYTISPVENDAVESAVIKTLELAGPELAAADD